MKAKEKKMVCERSMERIPVRYCKECIFTGNPKACKKGSKG